MKNRVLNYLLFSPLLLLLPSCNEETQVVRSETRELTTLDLRKVMLDPTSKDRFEAPDSLKTDSDSSDPHQDALSYEVPSGWKEKESTMFREINMDIAEGGEVYLSRVGGGLLDNVNRWYGQFGLPKVTESEIKAGESVSLLGKAGYIIKAEGDYNAGMGRPPQEGVTLLGVIAETENGLVTVKLIAPQEVAKKQMPLLKKFCASVSSN